jgi:hypothetical protein
MKFSIAKPALGDFEIARLFPEILGLDFADTSFRAIANPYAIALPLRGRGTMRSMVEGHHR